MKTSFVALAVAATLGLGSVSAFAQDHHHDGRGQAGWQHRGEGRGGWGYNQRYAAPRYYAPSYGYRHDNGDVVGALALGAITGALLGQAASNNYYAPPATYYAPPATYYTPPATYYPGYGYGYDGSGYGYYGN